MVSTNQTDKNHNKMGIDNDFHYEREDLLSDELATELSAYSREELLSRGYLVVGRKRGN